MTQPRPKSTLGDLLARKPAYTPIGTSLRTIGITPIRQDVDIDGETVDCLVIPVGDLMYREWMHLTGGGLNGTEVATT